MLRISTGVKLTINLFLLFKRLSWSAKRLCEVLRAKPVSFGQIKMRFATATSNDSCTRKTDYISTLIYSRQGITLWNKCECYLKLLAHLQCWNDPETVYSLPLDEGSLTSTPSCAETTLRSSNSSLFPRQNSSIALLNWEILLDIIARLDSTALNKLFQSGVSA